MQLQTAHAARAHRKAAVDLSCSGAGRTVLVQPREDRTGLPPQKKIKKMMTANDAKKQARREEMPSLSTLRRKVMVRTCPQALCAAAASAAVLTGTDLFAGKRSTMANTAAPTATARTQTPTVRRWQSSGTHTLFLPIILLWAKRGFYKTCPSLLPTPPVLPIIHVVVARTPSGAQATNSTARLGAVPHTHLSRGDVCTVDDDAALHCSYVLCTTTQSAVLTH